jgi:hypothetical protein
LAIFDTPTGGWPGGPVGNCDYIANSAQLKLELGLSLAIIEDIKRHKRCFYLTLRKSLFFYYVYYIQMDIKQTKEKKKTIVSTKRADEIHRLRASVGRNGDADQ